MIKETLIGSCEDEILAECRTALEKRRFSEDEIDLYLSHVANILNCYREHFGDDTKLEYHVRKRFNRIELRLVVQGEKVNPLEWTKERGDTGQSVEQALSPLVWNQTDVISHVYLAGRNIVTIVAQGSGMDLLNGWEFIVASYAAATICGAIKLFRVSVKYKVSAKTLWHKLKPMVSTAFMTSNNTTMMKQEYEISKNALGIKPEFSSFWIPMSQAMLNPRSTIMLTIPPFLILKYLGMPISTSFLLVLVILVLELSIASPGTTGGWTILFAALALPADYVGMFMTYRLACTNYNAAYGALQVGLEQIEAAYEFDAIDLDQLRTE